MTQESSVNTYFHIFYFLLLVGGLNLTGGAAKVVRVRDEALGTARLAGALHTSRLARLLLGHHLLLLLNHVNALHGGAGGELDLAEVVTDAAGAVLPVGIVVAATSLSAVPLLALTLLLHFTHVRLGELHLQLHRLLSSIVNSFLLENLLFWLDKEARLEELQLGHRLSWVVDHTCSRF